MKKATEKLYNMYAKDIVNDVRQNIGAEYDDDSKDEDILKMSKDEILERVLEWNGLVGFKGSVKYWVSTIFGVDLVDCEKYED